MVAKASYSGNITSTAGVKYAIVVAQFNSLITKALLEGCKESFVFRGVAENDIDVFSVPGSFELPVIAKTLASSGKYGAVVCIGAVIKGATSHYDAVVGASTNGIMNAGVNTGVPVVFGVLTCENLEQALDRAGGKLGNKGAEFAAVAVEMASLVEKVKKL
nr:6,7-dimethyl-8-ribityllumazine synthase (rib4) [Polytomella parva]|eukprot:CAMPEP_0175040628 /NCGR_PEP_ID=MMETSP0052_2-20121109/1385_1 /TAXON_ID=51329 ORGANISM="Polytomella parva, Strain SAG 63-3" /NCGR_SAMPLE_ID=MMETSP0052_2 /ASSEMBLY_ACC=CAM_ASM_000194 /LENGTH=160 /DNA_ID=CAMNT_0016302893 /DNA_START=187 /DNA_END=669 /DNA_ORIENTATION=+